MTELLYQLDSYLQQFSAVVQAVDEDNRSILLDRTIFYPGGGGQPADRGAIQFAQTSLPIRRARKSPEGVWHEVDGAAVGAQLPAVGEVVEGSIDWDLRYQLMRTHTAMHILCGVIFRDYGASVTGGDMEPLKGRMDFEFENLSKDLVGVIEAAVNEEMAKDHPIQVRILPREEAFRIPDLIRTKINLLPPGISEVCVVEIVGLDLQADGGTHVHSTAEVGRIRVVDYKSKGKINKRIYVEMD